MNLFFQMPCIQGPSILCLGTFDGVHKGHSAIIKEAVKLSQSEISPVIVYTFQKRPAEVLALEPPNLLTTHLQKAKRLSSMKVNALCIDKFNRKVASVSKEEWLVNLCNHFHPEHIFTGYNYTFGRHGEGNNHYLEQMQNTLGYTLHVMPKVTHQGEAISSTKIRRFIATGDIETANAMLGYAHTLGLQFVSQQPGVTAFKPLGQKVLPTDGDYETTLFVDGNSYHMYATLKDGLVYFFTNAQFNPHKKIAMSFSHRL